MPHFPIFRSFSVLLAVAAGALLLAPACTRPESSATPASTPPPTSVASIALTDIRVILHTTKGDIAGTLFADKTPMTVANWLNLAARGYYNGLSFHRVVPNFMIQGGDPLGTGAGGPGYRFSDETRRDLLHDKPGMFSMANADQGKQPWSNSGLTNGSQFFITHLPTPWLDGLHTVFGRVTSGQDVVNRIAAGDKITSIEVLDPTGALFQAQAANLARWNATLGR